MAKALPIVLASGAVLALASFAAGSAALAAEDRRERQERSIPAVKGGRGGRRKGVPGSLAVFHAKRVPWLTRNKDGVLTQRKNKKGEALFRKEVDEWPEEALAAAERKLGRRITLPAFVLATMIASEQGSDSPYVKGAVANAALNQAAVSGVDVVRLLTRGAGTLGKFGSQQGRFASTALAPTEEDLLVAEAVLDGRLPDVTGGAVQFDSPRAQRELVARGEAGYDDAPDEVAARRIRKGKEVFYLPGVDPDHLRFWRSRRERAAA